MKWRISSRCWHSSWQWWMRLSHLSRLWECRSRKWLNSSRRRDRKRIHSSQMGKWTQCWLSHYIQLVLPHSICLYCIYTVLLDTVGLTVMDSPLLMRFIIGREGLSGNWDGSDEVPNNESEWLENTWFSKIGKLELLVQSTSALLYKL